MKIRLVAVGKRMPTWVDEGFHTYQRRLQGGVSLELTEVAPVKRSANLPTDTLLKTEAKRIGAATPTSAWKVVLDQGGTPWSSAELARQMRAWIARAGVVALVIGGADGLDRGLIDNADQTWSLSALTLPHALVRVVVAEQLYRAWSLMHNHPYHRA